MFLFVVTAVLALALMFAVFLLIRETRLRQSLQTLLVRLLKKWRANGSED